MATSKRYIIKLCIVLLTINQTATTNDCGNFKFRPVVDDLGIEPIGSQETMTSSGQCAMVCINKYRSCYSFIFNKETGLCTPGSYLTSTGLRPSTSSETIFSLGSPVCNVSSGGFMVSNYSDVALCVYIAHGDFNNNEAFYDCLRMGAMQYQMDKVENWHILHPLLTENTRVRITDIHPADGIWETGKKKPLSAEVMALCFGAENVTSGGYNCVTIAPSNGSCVPIDCGTLSSYACQLKEPTRRRAP